MGSTTGVTPLLKKGVPYRTRPSRFRRAEGRYNDHLTRPPTTRARPTPGRTLRVPSCCSPFRYLSGLTGSTVSPAHPLNPSPSSCSLRTRAVGTRSGVPTYWSPTFPWWAWYDGSGSRAVISLHLKGSSASLEQRLGPDLGSRNSRKNKWFSRRSTDPRLG